MLNNFWNIGFFSEVHDERKMWGFLENKNGLCEIDLTNNNASIIEIFEEEKINQYRLFHYIYRMEDELLLLPGTAKSIYLYNLKSKTYKTLDFFGEAAQYNKKQWGFSACVGYKSKIFFLGCHVPGIVVWERLNNKMNVLKIPFDEISCEKTETIGFCADGCIVKDNFLWVALGCDNVLLKIDMESLEVECVHIGISYSGFGGIGGICDKFWIEDSGDLLFFERNSGKYRSIKICSKKRTQSFYAPICILNKVYLFPLYAEKAYVYDVNRDALSELKAVNEIICKKGRRLSQLTTLGLSVENNCISFFSGQDFTWHRFNCVDGTLSNTLLKLKENKEYYNRYITNCMQSNTPIKEGKIFLLTDYLECIKIYSCL